MTEKTTKRRSRRKSTTKDNTTSVLAPKNPYEGMSVEELLEVLKNKDRTYSESQRNNSVLVKEVEDYKSKISKLESILEKKEERVSELNINLKALNGSKLASDDANEREITRLKQDLELKEKELKSIPRWIVKLFN